jgi:hypothetical protein
LLENDVGVVELFEGFDAGGGVQVEGLMSGTFKGRRFGGGEIWRVIRVES